MAGGPELTIPLATVLSGAVDFGISFLVLLSMMLYYRILPNTKIFLIPLFVLLALVTSIGVGLWLSALTVEYRDVRYVVPFLVQFWMFATPIAYPSSLLSQPWRTLYGLNPMAGVVEGFRWSLLKTNASPGSVILASALTAIVLLITGAYYFRRMEKSFADPFMSDVVIVRLDWVSTTVSALVRLSTKHYEKH
jgi:lipopolysaccharide transport system permease protein